MAKRDYSVKKKKSKWGGWLNTLKDIVAPAAGFMIGGPAGAALGGALAGATGRGRPTLGNVAKGAVVGALTGGTTAGALQGARAGFSAGTGMGRLGGMFSGAAKGAMAGYQRPISEAAGGAVGSGLGMGAGATGPSGLGLSAAEQSAQFALPEFAGAVPSFGSAASAAEAGGRLAGLGGLAKEYAMPLAYGAQGVGSVLESRAQERIAERRLSMEEEEMERERQRQENIARILAPYFQQVAGMKYGDFGA